MLTVPSAGDSLVGELKRELLTRGWKDRPAPPVIPGGGFRSAPTPPPESAANRLTLCGTDQVMSANVVRHADASALVPLRVSTTTGFGVCNMPEMPTMPMRLPWPTLYNPAGVADTRFSGDCGATMSGSMGTGTTVRTTMQPDALLDHYARQLRDSGWAAAGGGAAVLGGTWLRPDATGATNELTLTISTPSGGAGCQNVNMQSRPIRKP